MKILNVQVNIENRWANNDSLNKKVDQVERQNKNLESIINQQNEKINQLSSKVDALSSSLDELEQYSKGANLIIHVIQSYATSSSPETDLQQHAIQLLNSNLGTNFQPPDIIATHRLGRTQSASTAGGLQQPSVSNTA